MDVRVQVPNDLVVKASSLETAGSPVGLGSLNVTLGGDIRATKERGDTLRLVGVVNTVRGNYDFQGRRFEILRDGSIRFEGLDRFDPRLDIHTRRLIQGVEARADIRGTLRQPEIRLSSTPPLEEADILSLIVFNVPINELGTGEQISLAVRAQSLATGAVANQIASAIGGILNLDTFEINLAPEFGNAPEVTFGEQVGKNLYVKIQQAVGDLSTTNLIIEYVLTDWLRLRGNVVQNGTQTQQSLFKRAETSGADMIFFFSY
jgi:translocation and assembly module TamB